MPDKKIGHFTLAPSDFAANPYGMEGELPLEDCKAKSATLSFQVHVIEADDVPLPQQQTLAPQTVMPQTAPAAVPAAAANPAVPAVVTSKLRVEILNAKMLPNKDSMLTGKSDPYVIAQVPGTGGMFKGKTKIQTPVINNDLNPVWDFTGDIPGFKPTDVLEFEVWDQDNFPKPDQLLGKTQLNPEDFQANPDGLEGELPLTGTSGEDAGTLAIRVHVLPDDGSAAGPATNGHPFGAVPIGSPYHGGILVSEHWNPPTMAPGATPRVPMMTHGPVPMMTHAPPMMTHAPGVPMMTQGAAPMPMPMMTGMPGMPGMPIVTR